MDSRGSKSWTGNWHNCITASRAMCPSQKSASRLNKRDPNLLFGTRAQCRLQAISVGLGLHYNCGCAVWPGEQSPTPPQKPGWKARSEASRRAECARGYASGIVLGSRTLDFTLVFPTNGKASVFVKRLVRSSLQQQTCKATIALTGYQTSI